MHENDNLFYERKYSSWREGLMSLFITVLMPLIPIAVYVLTQRDVGIYYYILLFTVIISFAFDFYRFPKKCSKMLKVESLICCVTLGIMFVWVFFMIVLNSDNNNIHELTEQDYALLSLFLIPVVITVVEIIRTFLVDFKSVDSGSSNPSIADGAKNV